MVSLTWNSSTGSFYQVEYSLDLANWRNAGDPVLAMNSNASFTDPQNLQSRRFYRVSLLP